MFTPQQIRNAELDIDYPQWYRRSCAAARNEVYRRRAVQRQALSYRTPINGGRVLAVGLVGGFALPLLMALTSSFWVSAAVVLGVALCLTATGRR